MFRKGKIENSNVSKRQKFIVPMFVKMAKLRIPMFGKGKI